MRDLSREASEERCVKLMYMDWECFGEKISNDVGTRMPLNGEYTLSNPIIDPTETHVHIFRLP